MNQSHFPNAVPQSGTVCITTADRGNERTGILEALQFTSGVEGSQRIRKAYDDVRADNLYLLDELYD